MQWEEGPYFVFWAERMVPRSLYVLSNFNKKESGLGGCSDVLDGNDSLDSIQSLFYKLRWPPPKSLESLRLLISQMNILCILLLTWVGRVLSFLVPPYLGALLPQLYYTPQLPTGYEFYCTHVCYPSSSVFPFPHLVCLLFPTKAKRVVHFAAWEGHFDGGQTLQLLLFSYHKQVRVHWALHPSGMKNMGVGE